MDVHLPALSTLLAFLIASLVLAVTPGPGVFYVLTRTLAQGRKAGLASVAGVALGNLGNAVGASIGLAALFAVSAAAFTVVKLAGAGYLVWLGIQALRGGAPAARAAAFAEPQYGRIFRDGFVVALLNPKTALFFAAFLPQFIDPAGSAIVQSVAYGAAFVAIAACTDASYALAAGAAAPLLARAGRGRGGAVRYVVAGAYFGLAAYTLALGSRNAPPKA
jgi:threonine/homoserine/homoserine lactone efflux protein